VSVRKLPKALATFLLFATTCSVGQAQTPQRGLTAWHHVSSSFTCLIVCMDGRYEPAMVANARTWAKVDCVDVVTEAGPCKYLGGKPVSDEDKYAQKSLLRRVEISIKKHGAKKITIGAHDECAGDPFKKELQVKHLRASRDWLQCELRKIGIIDIPIRMMWAEGSWKNPKLTEIP